MANIDGIVTAAVNQGILSFPSYNAPKDETETAVINSKKAIVISEFYRDLKTALSE